VHRNADGETIIKLMLDDNLSAICCCSSCWWQFALVE